MPETPTHIPVDAQTGTKTDIVIRRGEDASNYNAMNPDSNTFTPERLKAIAEVARNWDTRP